MLFGKQKLDCYDDIVILNDEFKRMSVDTAKVHCHNTNQVIQFNCSGT